MKYYYLLTGLQDLQRDGKAMPKAELMEQMQQQMPHADWQLVELLEAKAEDEVLPEEEEASPLSEIDRKTRQLYERGMKAKNAFVRDWFRFNMDLNNVLVAQICRKHGFDPEKCLLGELPDENTPEVEALSRIDNLYEREKALDALRWNWLEERTLMQYFDVENVLCYYLQCEILHRWDNLSVEEGKKIFTQIVSEMKKGVNLKQ